MASVALRVEKVRPSVLTSSAMMMPRLLEGLSTHPCTTSEEISKLCLPVAESFTLPATVAALSSDPLAPATSQVCCAFSFCWWAYGHLPTQEEPAETKNNPTTAQSGGRGKKENLGVLATDLEGGKGVAGALCHAEAIMEGILRDAPTTTAKSAA